jgi:hypothetical protein
LVFIGFISYVAILLVALCFLKSAGLWSFQYVYSHFTELAFASIVFSYAISFFVYINSFNSNKLLALGGNSGNLIYDVSS